jgi:hypothetical protein
MGLDVVDSLGRLTLQAGRAEAVDLRHSRLQQEAPFTRHRTSAGTGQARAPLRTYSRPTPAS